MTQVPEDLTALSDDELMQLWTVVGEEAQERREASKRLGREYEARLVAASARAKYEALSDPEKAALAQVFIAEGIESQEVVGNG